MNGTQDYVHVTPARRPDQGGLRRAGRMLYWATVMGKSISRELKSVSRELIAVFEHVVGLGVHPHLLSRLESDLHLEVGWA